MLKPDQLLSIAGPTGTGKTDLAATLASAWLQAGRGVSVISLDSRQVYAEFPQLSVADLPIWEKLQTAYPSTLHVYNLATLRLHEDWSFGVLLNSAREQVGLARRRADQIILVGGTIVCHERLLQTSGDFTSIPPDDNVRFAAENMSVEELQSWLERLDNDMYQKMNQSDVHNPRRLVRHIEIALATKLHLPDHSFPSLTHITQLWYLPDVSPEKLRPQIYQRVQTRFHDPAVRAEVRQVLADWPDILDQPKILNRTPLGFTQLALLEKNEIDVATALKDWQHAEWQYARRQLTWCRRLTADHHPYLINQRELLPDKTPVSLGNISGVN